MKVLYNLIKNEKFEWVVDDEEKKKFFLESIEEKVNGIYLKIISCIGSIINLFLDIFYDLNVVVYKSGFLVWKIYVDMDGKKILRGK